MARLLQDWTTEQAAKNPNATAVVCGGSQMTYGELDARSNQLARLLKDVGCARGDRVALLMPKSPMAIVGLLGIYKADAIYVPLDPASPANRLTKILDACENRWILAGGSVIPVLREILQDEPRRQRLSIGWLDASGPTDSRLHIAFTKHAIDVRSTAPTAHQNLPDDPAHILFTSGSTGTPKGVVITHDAVMRIVRWATEYFGIVSSDRLSGHPPLHFDMSFLDIFSAMAAGAELHLVPSELNTLPNKVAEFIRASAITQWFSVPSLLSYMSKFDVVKRDDFPSLRRVLWAGDVLPTPTLIYWMKRLPHASFTNLYGPTETTVVSSYYTVPNCPDDPRAPIPIGAACGGEELLVLDESMRPVPQGGTGTLYIGGAGLARGYWRDPLRTAAAFVSHPHAPAERVYKTGDLARVGDDGQVYFLGRGDHQIKSRGYRIELGEIEAAMSAVPGVEECAVVALHRGGFEGAMICCAYAAACDSNLTPSIVRRELARMIPSYMLPSHWLSLDRLPINANGKVDRAQLKDVFEARVNADAAPAARLA
ncbi:MAG TPA: amino acid adenylation domain-containing protein [Vicinamibacterales bacterium]|jgi:amino acid adenylation domain-containing protein